MKKITTLLNSPARLAGFTIGIVILVAAILFASMQAVAGSNENKVLGMDKGVNIALSDAGIKAENAENLTAHYETDDGISVYEVSFSLAGYEYEYTIKASDGKILEADREILKTKNTENTDEKTSTDKAKLDKEAASTDSANPAKEEDKSKANSSSNYIGADKAKTIALKDAGLFASAVTFTKAKLDREDGIRIYEIEFLSGNKEYEYEINASTGKILDKDIDIEDFDDDDWDD